MSPHACVCICRQDRTVTRCKHRETVHMHVQQRFLRTCAAKGAGKGSAPASASTVVARGRLWGTPASRRAISPEELGRRPLPVDDALDGLPVAPLGDVLLPHVGAAAALLAAGATREASSSKCGGMSSSPRVATRCVLRPAAAARLGGTRPPRRCGWCSAAVGASLLLAAALGAALRASERLSAAGLCGGIARRPRLPTRRGLRRGRLLQRLRRAPSLRGPSLRTPSLRALSLRGPSLCGPSLGGPSLRGPSLREEGVAPLAPAAPIAPAAPSVRGVGRVRPIRRR
jgi:hypothetical protein